MAITLPTINIPPLGNFVAAILNKGDVNVGLALQQLLAALQAYNKNVQAVSSALSTLGSSSTVTLQEITLSAPTTTINPSVSATPGALLVVVVTEDGTGLRQVTWNAVFMGVGATTMLDSRANAVNIFTFVGRRDGNWWLMSFNLGV